MVNDVVVKINSQIQNIYRPILNLMHKIEYKTHFVSQQNLHLFLIYLVLLIYAHEAESEVSFINIYSSGETL